jgi:hypothetical protein
MPAATTRPKRLSGQSIFLAVVLIGCLAVVGWLVATSGVFDAQAAVSSMRLEDIPFDGQRAYDYLKAVCELGPRPTGSPGMAAQQAMLVEHFEQQGGQVTLQKFRARHPVSGEATELANLIVQWHPDRQERVLLCAHYDTRPYPDRDSRRPRGTFIGANDGGSGTALLMELGSHMPQLRGNLGVDFVLFDAEEWVFRERDPYFLGSEHFANEHVLHPPEHRYRAAVLLDMIGDADLRILQERTSYSWRDSRPLIEDIWATARRLGVREFVARRTLGGIRDDHLALHDIAGIPATDLIDFDYPYWHTEQDLPQRCSALSLAKVGWVVHEWLQTEAEKDQ